MTRWDLMIWLVTILAALLPACQTKTNDGSAKAATAARTAAAIEPDDTLPQDEPAGKQKAGAPMAPTPQAAPLKPADDVVFAPNAFPPTVSDVDYHKNAWYKDDCLRCHETGVQDATVVRHKDMPEILLKAKCRSCHLLIRGQAPVVKEKTKDEEGFAAFAFPPMIPASASHTDAWFNDTCLLCHETGVRGAPIVKHKDMPKVLLTAKCRSCHVQVRSTTVAGR